MAMKKSLLVLTVLFLSVSHLLAQVPSYVPTDGLVGWWPFNGNANDESGNGNDGTVNGATLTEDRFGNVNSAYYFNGQSDNISVPHSNSIAITNDLTISVWKNSSGNTGGYETFVNKRGGNGEWNYSLGASHTFGPGGCPQEVNKYLTGRRNNAGAQYELRFSDYLVSDDVNQWTNVVLVIMNNIVHFYINGDLAGSSCFGNNFSIPSIDVQAPLTMGSCNCGLPEFFHGIMDDIAIYNRALTEQEIQNLYTGQCPTVTTNCTSLPSNLQQGLVGYWPFCGNANDESGNGNDGVVNGATLTEDRFGNAGSAYSFDGPDQFISTNSLGAVGQDPRTISLWFLSTTDDGELLRFGSGGYGGSWGEYITPAPGGFYFNIDNSNQLVQYNPILSLNEWHHVVTTFDPSIGLTTSSIKVYIDGSLLTNVQFNFNGNLELNTVAGNLIFGSTPTQPLFGKLDDISFFNRALTPEEVQELYTLDACTFTVYDTLTVENVINVYDTLTIENIVDVFDTTYIHVEVYDTLTVENIVNVYDTLIIENVVNVYDTLFTNVENIINVYDTTYTNIENVIDVYDTTTVVETIIEYDTLTIENIVEVYDTLTVENVIDVYDTTTVVETVLIYDTLTVENVIDVYDTTYVTVTDTLIIHVPTGVGGTILNTLLLYPNPTSDQLIINYGNFAAMAGYSLSIFDNVGNAVHEETNISQAQETLDISQWSAGVYQVVVYNTGGVPVETRQIVIQ